MRFWKKKQLDLDNILKSDEYEDLFKRLVAMRSDIDLASNRIEVINAAMKSNRARINQLKDIKIINDESEKDIKDGDVVYLGETRFKP